MSDDAINVLRLTRSELQAILDRLDESARGNATHSNRRTKRWPLRLDRTVLTIRSGPSQLNHLIVVPRNLSVEGIAVIHGGFIHGGTKCFVTLRDADGQARSLPAQVVRCQHIEKHLHEIGIHFDEPIDPRQFSVVTEGADAFNVDHVKPEDLEGTLLVIGERSFQASVAPAFEETELQILYASPTDELQGLLDEQPSLIFFEDPGLGEDARQTLALLATRTQAPIVVMAKQFCERERERLLEIGVREVIAWPCPAETLRRAAAEYLLLGDLLQMAEASQLGHSAPHEDHARIVDQVAALGERITQAMIADQAQEAASLAQSLLKLATQLGDPVLARRARSAAVAVTRCDQVAPDELGLLVRTCRQIKSQADSARARDTAA